MTRLPRLFVGALTGLLALASCGPPKPSAPTCKGYLPGDLVISEIMANPAGTDTGNEWFEIYNAKSTAANLAGVQLGVSKADKSGEKDYVIPSGTIPAGGYFVVGDADPKSLPTFEKLSYGNNLGSLRNTDGRIAITCAAATIDEVTYSSMSSGISWQLSGASAPDYKANDDPNNWCNSTNEYTTGSFGSPGQANEVCAGGPSPTQCTDGGTARDIVAPQPGDLVISEVMPNPDKVSDSNGEWFEVAVEKDVDLNGLQMGTTPGSPKVTLSDPTCLHATAGSYLVFAHGTDPTVNGGLPQVDGMFSFGLTNSGGSVFIGRDGAVLDQVQWTSSPTGASLSLDPTKTDPTANDDPANWCPAVDAYGDGDLGTPGAVNPACPPVVPAGSCDDAGTVRPIVPPKVGDLTITEYMANPSKVSDASGEWFEVKANADVDLNGLQLGSDPNTITVQDTLDGPKCIHVTAGTYLVFAHDTDTTTNGGIPKVDEPFSFGLTNSSGGLFLAEGGQLLDSTTWQSSTSGASTQLDPAGGKWCPGTSAYGDGDLGTPGTVNVACP